MSCWSRHLPGKEKQREYVCKVKRHIWPLSFIIPLSFRGIAFLMLTCSLHLIACSLTYTINDLDWYICWFIHPNWLTPRGIICPCIYGNLDFLFPLICNKVHCFLYRLVSPSFFILYYCGHATKRKLFQVVVNWSREELHIHIGYIFSYFVIFFISIFCH